MNFEKSLADQETAAQDSGDSFDAQAVIVPDNIFTFDGQAVSGYHVSDYESPNYDPDTNLASGPINFAYRYGQPTSQKITRTINITTPDGQTKQIKQEATLTRRPVKDENGTVTGFTDWSTGQWDAFTPETFAGYTASPTEIPAVTVKDGQADEIVNISYTAKQQTTNLTFVDQDGQTVKKEKVTGQVGETVAVTSTVPDGYVLASDQKIPATITFSGEPIPDITIKLIKKLTDTDDPEAKDQSILNLIRYIDQDGQTVKTDTVNGKAGDLIEVKIPDGHHLADGNLPALAISADQPVHTVNLVKDQTDKDTPATSDKDIVNLIRYVDDNGQVIKTETVSGKLGERITLKLPASYQLKDGQLLNLLISNDLVQSVQVVKNQGTTVLPDNPGQPGNQDPTKPNQDPQDDKQATVKPVEPAKQAASKSAAAKQGAVSQEPIESDGGHTAKTANLPQTGNNGKAALGLAGLFLTIISALGLKKRED